jgi:hypothetical protein
VISLDHVNMTADDAIPIASGLARSAHAEVAEKVQDIVLLDATVEVVKNCRVHLASRLKRPVAVANDVPVPKMKIRSKPRIDHWNGS